jgi:hypothetical protein
MDAVEAHARHGRQDDRGRAVNEPEEFGLWESLDREWLKLPLAVMRDVGPAVQTLAGLLELTDKETFWKTAKIAEKARVPIATVRKHLLTLDARGWIVRKGREHTRAGYLRRTATIHIPKATREKLTPYGVLPWWACRRGGRLPWSSRAVLSIVMGRTMSLKGAAQKAEDYSDPEELFGEVSNMGWEGEGRFRFSRRYLTAQTGLTKNAIVAAKRRLRQLGIIDWTAGEDQENGGTGCDLLMPNWDFRVVVTPAGEGRCYINFREVEGGVKTG